MLFVPSPLLLESLKLGKSPLPFQSAAFRECNGVIFLRLIGTRSASPNLAPIIPRNANVGKMLWSTSSLTPPLLPPYVSHRQRCISGHQVLTLDKMLFRIIESAPFDLWFHVGREGINLFTSIPCLRISSQKARRFFLAACAA